MRRMYSLGQLEDIASKQAKLVKKDIATLVDADGHDRFVEGDITLLDTAPSGVTLRYGKWSLSGTHLMIVVAGEIADTTALVEQDWCAITIPKWIHEKISSVFSNVISVQNVNARATNWSSQQISFALKKLSDNKIGISQLTEITFTAKRGYRVQFDLLIDND